MKKILSLVAVLSLAVGADVNALLYKQVPANQVKRAKLTSSEKQHAKGICNVYNRHVGEKRPRLTQSELKQVHKHLRNISSDVPKTTNFKKASQVHRTSPELLNAARQELGCR